MSIIQIQYISEYNRQIAILKNRIIEMQRVLRWLPSRPIATSLMANIEEHVTSETFIAQMNATKMVEQYSWVVFHWWLLTRKLNGSYNQIYPTSFRSANQTASQPNINNNNINNINNNNSNSNDRFANKLMLVQNLQLCMEQYTREHAYEYQQFFDIYVYDELKRRQATLVWSLDDYYLYHHRAKPLRQIIIQDMLAITPQQHTHFSNNDNQNTGYQKQQQSKIASKIEQKCERIRKYIAYSMQQVGKMEKAKIVGEKAIGWRTLHLHEHARMATGKKGIADREQWIA